MSQYFPQVLMELKIRWEDFGNKFNPLLTKVHQLRVIPKRVGVHINDYATADTFDCELDFKNFPFDPRTIRACGVSIWLDDRGQLLEDSGADTQIKPTTANTIFQGFVDDDSIECDEDRRIVKFEGRDFTSLFIDTKYHGADDKKGPLPMTTPLDVLLRQLMGEVKGAEKIQLANRTGTTLPTLASFAGDFDPLGNHKSISASETYWEVIQDLVARAGLICFIEIDKLVITTPRTMYNPDKATQFFYGRNVKNFNLKRKLGRHKGFNIMVRYMDLAHKEVLSAEIPKEATTAWSLKTGVKNERVQVSTIDPKSGTETKKDGTMMAFRLARIKNKDHLIEVGQKIYEELSRQEVEGSFETHELEIENKKGDLFQMNSLRIGNPVSIEMHEDDLDQISRMKSIAQRAAYLEQRSYDPVLATAFATSLGLFSHNFFTKAINYNMDVDAGVSIKVEFINFIELGKTGATLA